MLCARSGTEAQSRLKYPYNELPLDKIGLTNPIADIMFIVRADDYITAIRCSILFPSAAISRELQY